MIISILTGLFVVSRLSAALTSFALIIGTAVYDWRVLGWQKQRRRHPSAKLLRKRPLVSVLVFGDDASLDERIESIAKNTYHNLEIIKIGTTPRGRAKPKRSSLSKLYPLRTIKQMSLPHARREMKGWSERLKRTVKGDIVLTLDSSASLHPRAVYELVAYFALNQQAEEVVLRSEVQRSPTLTSLVNEYELAFRASVNKNQDVLQKLNRANIPAVAWRRHAFLAMTKPKSKNKNSPMHFSYAHNASVVITPKSSPLSNNYLLAQQLFKGKRVESGKSRWLAWLQKWYALILLLEPIVLSYSIYVFVAFGVSILLVTTWLIITASFGFFVWGDEQISVARRLRLTLLLPLMLSMVYVIVFTKIWDSQAQTLQKVIKLRLPKHLQLSWLKR